MDSQATKKWENNPYKNCVSLEQLNDFVSQKFGKDNDFSQILKEGNPTQIKRKTKQLMFQYLYAKDPELLVIGRLAFASFQFLDGLPLERFQIKATEYFLQNIGAESISFKEKIEGEQFGNCIVACMKDGEVVTYYAKTHRGGFKADLSGTTYPVDLKELLVYRILELLGIGPETHFFYNDVKEFYIATKDVAYDVVSKKQGEFVTYKRLRESHSPQELLANPLIVKGFTLIDIISRLLVISDVINNGGNTGIQNKVYFKIVDFLPPFTRQYQYPRMFQDWLSGNNRYDYSDPVVISILQKADQQEKIRNLISQLKELNGFEQIVKKSHQLVLNFIEQIQGISEEQVRDLEYYTNSALANYGYLMQNIESLV